MLNALYTAAFALVVPCLLVRVAWRGISNHRHWHRWYERLGFYRQARSTELHIWVHAVSVGESTAAVPLIRGLMERFPEYPLVVSTTTLTGGDNVARVFGNTVKHVYFPFDLPWIVGRFLRWHPSVMLIILETELWPNTLATCARNNVPAVLVNARLSQKSRDAYLKVAAFSREFVQSLTRIVAQSYADQERFRILGAVEHQLAVSGSLKFDLELPASLHEQGESLRYELGVSRRVLMLGSTRDGEEALLFDAMSSLQARFSDLLIVIAPRHPERFDSVGDACRAAGFELVSRSSGQACQHSTQIYLLDSMGELPRFYAAADVAFVGGSLLPFGGHNVLEPAALGTPVICGRHTFNFAEICELLKRDGVLKEVDDAAGFAAAASAWLDDSNERDRVGRLGQEIVRRHRGATEQTLDIIQQHLPDAGYH